MNGRALIRRMSQLLRMPQVLRMPQPGAGVGLFLS